MRILLVLGAVAACSHQERVVSPIPAALTPAQRVATYHELEGTDAEALTPIVARDSASARAVRRADRHASTAQAFAFNAAVSVLAGLAIGTDRPAIGIAIMAGGGLGFSAVAGYFAFRAHDAREDARSHVPSDLRARLRLCVTGIAVAPCEDVDVIGPGETIDPISKSELHAER